MIALGICLAICLLLSAIALAVVFKSVKFVREQKQKSDQAYDRLSKEVSVSNASAVALGQRLLAIEKRLQASSNQTPTPQKMDYYNDENFLSYSQAAELFKMGLDADEVARRCGLSRAETSLIQMMQLKESETK